MPEDKPQEPTRFAEMSWRTFASTAATGLLTGATVWGLTYLISQEVIPRLVCNTSSDVLVCTQSAIFASNLATIIGGLIGVLILLKLNVFRPLLVAVVTAIALWNIEQWVRGGAWYEPLALTAGLYCLSYVTFAWFARVHFLRIAIIIIILTILAINLLPSYLDIRLFS